LVTATKRHYLGGLMANHKIFLEEVIDYLSESYVKKAESNPDLYYQRIEKAHN